MTAVVQPLPPRNGWSSGPEPLLNNMSTADSRMFVPRKGVQRSNSSSSLASSTSSSSTVSASSALVNGVSNGETILVNGTRKKGSRGVWPASSKSEPVASMTNARSQSVPASALVASAVSALHTSAAPSSQHQGQTQAQQNNASQSQTPDKITILALLPLNGTFERKEVVIPMAPDVLRIGRQTNLKTLPTRTNGFFDSKVLSRQHAEVWSDRSGLISIRDVGSSNGTFVNGRRLSPENKPSETEKLNQGDILELGIDIVSDDQKVVVHHKVAARVEFAGLRLQEQSLSFGDLEAAALNEPNGRGRTQSQGTNGNGRYSGAGLANGPTSYHAKWLQPVTTEQIAKRLGVELKQAHSQSAHIHSKGSVLGAMIQDRKSDAAPTSVEKATSMSPKSSLPKSGDNIKARFATAPPVPPPSQPLPEAPIDAGVRNKLASLPALPPILRRSDTEKPKAMIFSASADSSPVKPPNESHVLDLVEALSTAQKEIATQSQRLKEVEDALNHERESRITAEERAIKLETANFPSAENNNAAERISQDSTPQENAQNEQSSGLQRRIDLMRAEMDEMKALMAQYKHRVETAEADSRRDRQSLAEMVDSIQRREEATRRKVQKRRDQGNTAVDAADDDEARALDEELSSEAERAQDRLHNLSKPRDGAELLNGSATSHISITHLQELGQAAITAAMEGGSQHGQRTQDRQSAENTNKQSILTRSRRQDQLVQSAPYASLIGVVLLGVGMMAYLNSGWQKVADR